MNASAATGPLSAARGNAGMQILTRRSGESLYIDISESVDPATPIGDVFADGPLEIEVVQAGRQVKLAIDAAPSVARALEIGNQVDDERGFWSGWSLHLPAIDPARMATAMAGAVVGVIIAALGWWAGMSQSPAVRQAAVAEAPVQMLHHPAAQTPLAESRNATAPSPQIHVAEPPHMAEIAASEAVVEAAAAPVPPRPAAPEVMTTQRTPQRGDAIVRSEDPPTPEVTTPPAAEPAPRTAATVPVAAADENGSESEEIASRVLSAMTQQTPALAQRDAVTSPQSAPQTHPEPTAPGAEAIYREAWLLEQAPDRYTLQLFGVSHETAVRNFLRKHPLNGPVAYYRTKLRDRDWFVVLYGLYPDVSSAREDFAQLSKAARPAGFYTRSMRSVQASIIAAAEQR